MTRLLVLAMMLTVTACTSGPASSDLCAGWAPIRPTVTDVNAMSGVLVAQVLAHNMHGAQLCGWAP
jgi:hypothetical protein